MQTTPEILLAALRETPRRYRLPPLPADGAQARAAGVETALAFAIAAAREGVEQARPVPEAVRALFVQSLASFLRDAMAPQGGDPAFQALVLQAHDAEARESVQLAGRAAADRRSLRSAVDAFAHPGKTRALPASGLREALEQLHALSVGEAWGALRDALQALPAQAAALRGAAEAILASEALARLLRRDALLGRPAVQRHQALCALRGPPAGSPTAAAQGRSAARAGAEAERATVAAFGRIAALLQARAPAEGAYRVLRSLRPPAAFPGAAGKAKDEWDAAIACGQAIVLLAEVKASPGAASSDFARLQRGLQRLAQADPLQAYDFASANGPVRLAGASLRALQPPGRGLPPHVIYCCTAPAETQPPLLAAASKAVLAAEPASLSYAQLFAQGAEPSEASLLGVWEALLHAPRLRATLHQDATARMAREAMLHPEDLLATLAAAWKAL